MGLIRDIKTLHPLLLPKAEHFLRLLKEYSLDYIILETFRLEMVQKAYYAQGRKPLAEVNELRKGAGLWEISEKENSKRITWTMESKHLKGFALDVVPYVNGKIPWSASFDTWEQYGLLGERAGLEWGGRWETPDCPHYELSDYDIQNGWSDVGAGGL